MTVDGPDRGYSWVIMICCAYIYFALLGLLRSWGIVYVAIIKEYGATREEASWAVSLCAATFQLVGPAVSVITHYISTRLTCLLSSVIATLGVVACYFAPNVLWITICYGVVHGVGFGVIVTLVPVFLNQYFKKYRATAIGIAFSGGSLSSFIFPIVIDWLLDSYDLKGTFLILGGVMMNLLVASALLRPAPWLKKPKKCQKLIDDSEAKDSGVSTSGDVFCDNKENLYFSDSCIKPELEDSVFIENRVHEIGSEPLSITDSCKTNSTEMYDPPDLQATLLSNKDSILFRGTVTKVTASDNSDSSFKNSPKKEYEVEKPLMNENFSNSEIKNDEKRSKFEKAAIAILDILKKPKFYLICSSMYVYFLALQCFFITIIDFALDKGLFENEGLYILSIFSLTDLIGRAGLGWITDQNYIKRNNMIIFNLTVIGVIFQLYPLINGLTGLLVLAAFHGLPVGSSITLFFVLQAEYLGMKRLTLVVGLCGSINGALTLVRPIMIGLFRDTIGSYNWMYHMLGFLSLLFALIWLIESWTTKNTKSAIQSSCERA